MVSLAARMCRIQVTPRLSNKDLSIDYCGGGDACRHSLILITSHIKHLTLLLLYCCFAMPGLISLREQIPLTTRKSHYSLDCSKPVEIHLFIDGSVVEGFINNQDAFTTRIFPMKESSDQVELFSDGKTAEAAADVWMIDDAKVKMNF
jgi:hypothetical protein